jgi:hypothetical protein
MFLRVSMSYHNDIGIAFSTEICSREIDGLDYLDFEVADRIRHRMILGTKTETRTGRTTIPAKHFLLEKFGGHERKTVN